MSTNTVDYGAQRLSFDYRSDAKASLFNKILYNLLPYGIYNGGTLARLSNTAVSLQPVTVIIDSNNSDEVAVKIDTTEAQTISLAGSGSGCDITKPYIILRFGWADEEENYMDILASAYSDILSTDIIVGKVNFELLGSDYIIATVNSFDYSRRNAVDWGTVKSWFKVTATEPPSNKVNVSGGVIVTSKGKFSMIGAALPTNGITVPTASRIDILGIDGSGNFQYIEGIAGATPVAPLYNTLKVLAEIHLSANQTVIKGSDIIMLNAENAVPGTIDPEDMPIVDPNGHFPTPNNKVTAALHYLWTHSLVLNHNSPEVSQYQIDAETNVNYPLGDLFI